MSVKTTYNEPTIEYSELEAARFSVDGLTGRVDGFRRLKCAWVNRFTLIQQLLGSVEAVGDNLIVHSPHRFPVKGLEKCIARSVPNCDRYLGGVKKDITQPSTTQTRVAAFEFAQIDINYSTHVDSGGISVPENGEIWRRENIRNATELITFPNKEALSWSASTYDKVEGGEIPGYLIHRIEWSYTRKIPGNPSTSLFGLGGHVNQYALRSPTYGYYFAPETLQFIGPQFSVDRDIKGKVITETTILFHSQKEGWNNYPHQVGGVITFVPIYDKTTHLQIKLPYADFRGWII